MRRSLITAGVLAGALLAGATPAGAHYAHTAPDGAGRPPGHALYGADPVLEDGAGWDCRYSGNRVCGSDARADTVTRAALARCDARHAVRHRAEHRDARDYRAQDRWVTCADSAYRRG